MELFTYHRALIVVPFVAFAAISVARLHVPTDKQDFYETQTDRPTERPFRMVAASDADRGHWSVMNVTGAAQMLGARGATLQPSAWTFTDLGQPSNSNVKLADLDGDGTSEAIVTTVGSRLIENPFGFPILVDAQIHALSAAGAEPLGWPITLSGRALNNTAAIGDINGDGRSDIIVQSFGNFSEPSGTDPEKVWAFSAAGVPLPGFPVAIGPKNVGFGTGLFTSGQTPSPTLADLDGDKVLDIVAVSTGVSEPTNRAAVVAINGSGQIVFRTVLPRTVITGQFFDEYPAAPVPMVGHLTGSALPEIIVGVHAYTATPYTTFYALTAAGNLLPNWGVRVNGGGVNGCSRCGILETGALGDLDRDGRDEFVVTSPRQGSDPAKVHVFDGSGQSLTGFPKDLPGSGGSSVYPVLADVNRDGVLDIIVFTDADLAQDGNYYLSAIDRFGQVISQTVFPAIRNGLFGQGITHLRMALVEDEGGQVCVVFPIPQFPPNQANIQLHAMYLDGQVVPGFPVTLPNLCDIPFCEDAASVSLARDTGFNQIYATFVDRYGNVRRWDVFSSTKLILWSQFQHDPANTGRTSPPFPLTAAPVVTNVTPASGSSAGGTAVTITGTNFFAGAHVTFGGTAATNVQVVNPTILTCTTRAHRSGAVSIHVTNPNGQAALLSSVFTYFDVKRRAVRH